MVLGPLTSTHAVAVLLAARRRTQELHEGALMPVSTLDRLRVVQAAAAATWEALHALVAGQEAQLLQEPELCLKLTFCLGDVAATAPAVVSGCPELEGGAAPSVRQSTLKAAGASPRLCAGMLSAGLLAPLLTEQAPGRELRGGQGAVQAGAANCLTEAFRGLQMVRSVVCRGAESGGSQASAASAGGEAGEQEQACRLRVQHAAAALDRAMACAQRGSGDSAEMLGRVLPPAEALAAALQEWWALPEQVAAARLEAAQAAAVRSCANLRCANLGLEGGAAAGEGVCCKRCSVCRVSCYCGRDCQEADWHAGHRKVCSELAAERQRQRAQQQEDANS
ncbi:hypothetical protein ABPG75_002769 [Micractinium tetrahymenae]